MSTVTIPGPGLSRPNADIGFQRDREPSYLLVPGWRNSGRGHWQTLWERQLPGCTRVQQHEWENPTPDQWVASLERIVSECSKPVVLIAHSLGCYAVARWAAACPSGGVAAALLVAPPAPDTPTECRHVVARFQGVASPLPFPALLVGSENDPYGSLEAARGLAHDWGADFINAGRVGHINVESGHGPWPQGRAILQGIVAKATAAELSA